MGLDDAATLRVLRRVLRALVSARRRVYSVALMAAGVGSAAAGTCVLWGIGWALLVLAAFLVPLSLLTGWE